ncbi:hypothetical protein QE152_g5280 [Popillia japonica]|uniref:Uncharacterized protein n=1 Tax=Popillia japonica TaxID=7064 RepID=A0AAW1MQR3_POPJA
MCLEDDIIGPGIAYWRQNIRARKVINVFIIMERTSQCLALPRMNGLMRFPLSLNHLDPAPVGAVDKKSSPDNVHVKLSPLLLSLNQWCSGDIVTNEDTAYGSTRVDSL